MTALAAALHAAGHATPAAMPTRRPTPAELDPQTTFTYWHHTCPADGCKAWVPNHRRSCTHHTEETP